jgi:small subunit ribosomal protein S6
MRSYELTIILRAKATAAKKKAVKVVIEKLVKTFKGRVAKAEDWGERDFAYSIAKNNSGVFLHFKLNLEPKAAKDLDAKLRLEQDVLRYLLVRND